MYLQTLSIDVLYRTSKIPRTGPSPPEIKKPTRSKQPAPQSHRVRPHAPVGANSHKGSIVQTTKKGSSN